MLRMLVAVVVCLLAFPGVALAETVVPPPGNGPLLTAGLAAVQRLAVDTAHDRNVAPQLQMKNKLKTDKRTVIILVCVAAVAAVIWFDYALGTS